MIRILVVDDDANTRMFLQAVLENNGYTVSQASNGRRALEVMDKEHIDLVVLDVMMPEMDGYEFTKIVRESQNNLPILMVSAKQLPADKHKGFIVGTDDYITKPIDDEEMIYRIKALLRRAKIASDRKIEIGEVVLDYDGRIATIDKLVDHRQQLAYILEVKTRCGLVQNVERASRVVLRELGRELYALALTTR